MKQSALVVPFVFCEQRITFLYQVLGKIDAVKEKQFRGVDVSLIALSVRMQLKMPRAELNQHGCSPLSNEKPEEISFQSMYCMFLL